MEFFWLARLGSQAELGSLQFFFVIATTAFPKNVIATVIATFLKKVIATANFFGILGIVHTSLLL